MFDAVSCFLFCLFLCVFLRKGGERLQLQISDLAMSRVLAQNSSVFWAWRSEVDKRGRSKRSRTQKSAKRAQMSANERKPQVRQRAPKGANEQCLHQKNPRAHPPPQTQNNPSKKRGIYGHGGFSCRKNTEILGAHKIGAAISGPRIADKNFTDTRIFLITRKHCQEPGSGYLRKSL